MEEVNKKEQGPLAKSRRKMVGPKHLHANLKAALDDPTLCDIIIRVNPPEGFTATLSASSWVLSMQSPVSERNK